MHHERDPVYLPAPIPQAEGLPPFSLEQMQALVTMAQAMAAMSAQPGLNPLATPCALTLPGQMEVLGVTDLQSLVDEYLDNLVARGRSEGTLANYQRALKPLVKVCTKLPVTAAHVREAITKPTWRQTTRFMMYTHIRAFLNELEVQYGIPNAACRSIGKVDRGTSKRRILDLGQMMAVYDAATVTTVRPQYHRLTLRNQILVLLIIECGPRVREIANLRICDVIDGWVCLDGKTGPRWVPVSQELTDLLRALADGDVVFANFRGKPMTDRDVDYLVSGLQEKAGITGWYLGVHLMRHSFATNYLRNGGGVFQLKEIMGHASIATTMRYVKLAGVDVKMDQSKTSLGKALGLVKR